MQSKTFLLLLVVVLSMPVLMQAQTAEAMNPTPQEAEKTPPPSGDFAIDNPLAQKLPKDVILVKGATPSASDASTPLPEGGNVTEKIYTNPYFGITYALPAEWRQKYAGPPPSDGGYYVLAQIEPSKTFTGPSRGSILISAQDLFFGYIQAGNALELVKAKRVRLNADYKLERQPMEVTIAGRTFYRMDYMSPVAELHWYTLTTQIRCHSVEFMLTSIDTALLENLVQGIDKAKLAEENAPVCVKNYAAGDNVLLKVDPVFGDRKFNPVPVRIIIDRYGKVKHIHVISAFPEQARAITTALLQWEFKPYKKNGEPVELETGIMFGHSQIPTRTATSAKD